MMLKQMIVVAIAAAAFVGTSYADGPKVNPAQQEAALRASWQQGFERGYRAAMIECARQKAEARKQAIARREAAKKAAPKCDRPAPQCDRPPCTKGACGDRPAPRCNGDRPPCSRDGNRPCPKRREQNREGK